MNPSVYLSGPITGRVEDIQWRGAAARFCAERGIAVLDPMRGKSLELVGSDGLTYDCQPVPAEFADRDADDIAQADIVLVHIEYIPDRILWGTPIEIGMAIIECVPVVLSTGFPQIRDHLFSRRFCAAITTNLEDALQEVAMLADALRAE